MNSPRSTLADDAARQPEHRGNHGQIGSAGIQHLPPIGVKGDLRGDRVCSILMLASGRHAANGDILAVTAGAVCLSDMPAAADQTNFHRTFCSATTSISTSAPLGSALTDTQERAGFSVKY